MCHRYLTAREQKLREHRRRVTEQLTVDEKLKEKEQEIERLDQEKRALEKLHDDNKSLLTLVDN